MDELKYDKTFEQALGAVKQGHSVRFKNSKKSQRSCKSLGSMLAHITKCSSYTNAEAGWAIIKKPTDRERLIAHFEKEGAEPKLVKYKDRFYLVLGYQDDRDQALYVNSAKIERLFVQSSFNSDNDFSASINIELVSIASKSEVLSLLLEDE